MIATPRLWILAALLCCTGFCLPQAAVAANQARKKTPAIAGAATGNTPPSRANDLNSPSTDFSGVSPELEDPKADMIRPHKKKDPNFD